MKINFTRNVHLSKRQELILRQLSKKNKGLYLGSLIGFRQNISLYNLVGREANDSTQYTSNSTRYKLMLSELYNTDSDVNHVPRYRNARSKWTGIEIECYIDGINMEGESGECYNCDGSGHVYTTDDNNNEYCNDCSVCEGNGTIETESNEKLDDLKHAIRNAGIKRVSLRRDGSLDEHGIEICHLFDASKGFDSVQKLCNILSDFGATVDASCGFHCHLDVANLGRDRAWETGRKISNFLPVLSKLVPKSRRENDYCKLKASDTHTERYCAVNLASIFKHNTIEVRLHSGTTNVFKIVNWVKLLWSITDYCINNTAKTKTYSLKVLKSKLSLDNELYKFYLARYKKFKDNAIDENIESNEYIDDNAAA